MVDMQWPRHGSYEDVASARSYSLQNQLAEALKELSYRKYSVKGFKVMTAVQRRMVFTSYTLLMILPSWILMGTTLYCISPIWVRLTNLKQAHDAQEMSSGMRQLGEALTEECTASHRLLRQQGPDDYRRMTAAYTETDRVIQQSLYLSPCLSKSSLAVSTKTQLEKYLNIFREDRYKRSADIPAFYNHIIEQVFSCGRDVAGTVNVEDNWNVVVVYRHLLSEELYLSKLRCLMPVHCSGDDSTDMPTAFRDEIIRLSNYVSAYIRLVRYFLGDQLWWMNDFALRDPIGKETNTVCENLVFYDHIYNSTCLQAERQTSDGLKLISKLYREDYVHVVSYIIVTLICAIFGTVAAPTWVVLLSRYLHCLNDVIQQCCRKISEENNICNLMLYKLMPIKCVSNYRMRKMTIGPHNYDCVTMLCLSVPNLKTLHDSFSPTVFFNVINLVLNLIEDRLSLYTVNVLQRASCSYVIVSGLNDKSSSQHVTDIANLALDLLISCSDLELDSIPDSRIQLRMGIHTGPCIGMLRKQSPLRYHVIGTTLHTTKQLERTSELNAIHVSEKTADILRAQRFYRLEPTSNISIKGKRLTSSWLLGRRVSSQSSSHMGRRSTSASLIPEGKIQLSPKPMYRYDIEEGAYIPLPPAEEPGGEQEQPDSAAAYKSYMADSLNPDTNSIVEKYDVNRVEM